MLRFATACFAVTLLTGGATAASPYRLVATTALPAMPEGDFDQLAADVAHNRLYVSAEDGATMYVFDLTTGALIRSGGDVRSPHKVAFDARRGHLFVADGDDGSVKVLNSDLTLVARIPVGPKADTGVFDPRNRIFYVSSRDPDAPESSSIISAIGADSLKVVSTWQIPATTLKGLVLDESGRRLIVALRDKNAIGIIHLDSSRVDIWTPAGLHKPVPLAIDAAHGSLYVGIRSPGELDVLDNKDGHLRAHLSLTETSDSMSLDDAHGLLYVSGDSGMSRYRITGNGAVRFLGTDRAVVGKTSLYVADKGRLYVMRPRKGQIAAALTVFDCAND